tara:strand:+ start:449 stop:1012 length:564 start_codon:yes stop_codon:yes gene_type:complete
MKIGLFFGTFDPVHLGHLNIGLSVLKTQPIDQIWFVLTPTSPFKINKQISAKEHRLNMLSLALEQYDALIPSDIEFAMERPHYTSCTLRHITAVYPKCKFVIIMGSDNYSNIQQWKDSNYILDNFPICIYNRAGYSLFQLKNTIYIPGENLSVSSSEIRNNITSSKTKKHLHTNVLQYISNHSLYEK